MMLLRLPFGLLSLQALALRASVSHAKATASCALVPVVLVFWGCARDVAPAPRSPSPAAASPSTPEAAYPAVTTGYASPPPGVTDSSPAPAPVAPTTASRPARPEGSRSSNLYPLVVSFGSECCGTDDDAAAALEHILRAYNPEQLGRQRSYWGKEGEYELCFTLAGLSPDQRRSLIDEVKSKIRYETVSVTENESCRSGR